MKKPSELHRMIAQQPVPPPKGKPRQYQEKTPEKWILNLHRCARFHTKTRVSPRYSASHFGPLREPPVPSSHFKCPKRTFMLPEKYHASVLNMLSKPQKCSCKTKTNINFRGQGWVRPPAKFWPKGFILPNKYHSQIFAKDSGIRQLTKNAKTNSNIAGHHLVRRRVISTSSDVQPM